MQAIQADTFLIGISLKKGFSRKRQRLSQQCFSQQSRHTGRRHSVSRQCQSKRPHPPPFRVAAVPHKAERRSDCSRIAASSSYTVEPEFRCKSLQQRMHNKPRAGICAWRPGCNILGLALPVGIGAKGDNNFWRHVRAQREPQFQTPKVRTSADPLNGHSKHFCQCRCQLATFKFTRKRRKCNKKIVPVPRCCTRNKLTWPRRQLTPERNQLAQRSGEVPRLAGLYAA